VLRRGNEDEAGSGQAEFTLILKGAGMEHREVGGSTDDQPGAPLIADPADPEAASRVMPPPKDGTRDSMPESGISLVTPMGSGSRIGVKRGEGRSRPETLLGKEPRKIR
jgi:hypothetical protein